MVLFNVGIDGGGDVVGVELEYLFRDGRTRGRFDVVVVWIDGVGDGSGDEGIFFQRGLVGSIRGAGIDETQQVDDPNNDIERLHGCCIATGW